MSRQTALLMPATSRILREVGENLRLARLRRGLSSQLVAERAGMSRPTLRAVESGDPSCTMAAYANVLQALGLQEDLRAIAKDDELGRKLVDAGLPTRPRSHKGRP